MDATAGFMSMGGGGGDRGDRGRKSPPPAFMFPVLKFTQITECLEELEIELTKAELSEPVRHRDRLKQMWLEVLEVCTGQTEEELCPTTYSLPENVSEEFRSSHTGFGDIPLFRALRKLMEIAGYEHFSMRDLYAPDTKRLKHQLSAIINLAKHRDEQLRFYTELIEPRAEFIAALEEVDDENKQLQEQLTQAKQSSKIKSTELKEIMDECNELEVEIGRDNRIQATLREEAAQLKRQANDMKDELTAAEWTLEELEAKEQNLRAQIVSSPERRKQEAEELRARVQLGKKENSAIEHKIQQCTTSVRNLQKTEKDLLATTTMLRDLHQSATKYMDLVQSIDDIKAKTAEQTKKLQELVEETKQTQRKLHRSDEEILAQRKQHAMELEAAQEALDSFKSQLLVVEKDRREGMLRVQKGEAEVQAIKAAMEAERVKTEREIQQMIAQYKKAERCFMERDRARRAVLGINTTEANSQSQD